MGKSSNFVYDGETYQSSGNFLSAMRQAYRQGDHDGVNDALEFYGFDLGDIGC